MAQSLVNDNRGTRIVAGLVPALYDKVTIAYPDSVTSVFSFFYSGQPCGIVTLIVNGTGDLISAERTA